MKFNELKEILKRKYGIDHLADIARELGVSPQAVSNWKSRDSVPYKYVIRLRKKNEIESDDNIFRENLNDGNDDQLISSKGLFNHDIVDNNINLIDLLIIIIKNFQIILISTVLLSLLSSIYVSYFIQPVFVSTAKMLSAYGGTSNLSQAAGLASQFGLNLPNNSSEPRWVYTQIIKSRTIAKSMLLRKFDTKKFGQNKSLLQILTYGNGKPGVSIDTLEIYAVNSLIGMIDFKEDISTGINTLNISTFEPKLSADIASALIEELDAHQRAYNNSKISQTREFVEERIIEVEKELNASEEELKNFRDQNRRLENSPALLLEQQRLLREVSVLTGVFTTLKQQLEMTKIEEVKESDYVIILDPPEIPLQPKDQKKMKKIVLTSIAGIGIGLFLAFFREYLSNSPKEDLDKLRAIKSILIKNILIFIPFRIKEKLL